MAQMTIELRHLLATGFDIGLKSYPIPEFADETWRKNLNNKIINHYYFREICDTPEKFKHFINMSMSENMPKFCLLYEAANTKFSYDSGSILTETYKYNMNENEEGQRGLQGNTDSTSNSKDQESSENYLLRVDSTTPGKMLNVEDDIENNTYASSAQKNKGNDSSSATSDTVTESNTTENEKTQKTRGQKSDYNKVQSGVFNKSNSELFKEYAESIRNIDLEVIQSLADCFIGIF